MSHDTNPLFSVFSKALIHSTSVFSFFSFFNSELQPIGGLANQLLALSLNEIKEKRIDLNSKRKKVTTHSKDKSWEDLLGPCSLMSDPKQNKYKF